MKIKNLSKTIIQEYNNFRNENQKNLSPNLNTDEGNILNQLQDKGYAVVQNFFAVEKCEKIRNEIDNLIEKHADQLQIDEVGSDHRIFGADRVSEEINLYFKNDFINKIINSHEGFNSLNGCILAARMEYKPENLGSGGGWHRDRADRKQTKAILYLSDVTLTNGPFQFIEGSHTSKTIIKDMIKYNFSHNQTRFTDAEIDKMLKNIPDKLKTFTGMAGTLIFVNTRGIHRGMPIKASKRYALTSYNWPHEIPSSISSLFIK